MLLPMRECMVEMVGDDGEIHELIVEATSLYDAAERAIREWALYWWFNPNAGLTVRSENESWTVSQKQLRAKRAAGK